MQMIIWFLRPGCRITQGQIRERAMGNRDNATMTVTEIRRGFNRLGFDSNRRNRGFTWARVRRQITIRRPILVRIGWSYRSGGHAVVIRGYDNRRGHPRRLYVNDPLPRPHGSEHNPRFERFRDHADFTRNGNGSSRGQWTTMLHNIRRQ